MALAGHCCSFKTRHGLLRLDVLAFLTCRPVREGVNSEEDTGAGEVLVDKYAWKASGDVWY